MQNESLRLHAGYGVASRFPHLAVTATSTRFWPIYSIDAYRTQTWNGEFKDEKTNLMRSAYVEERGAQTSVTIPFPRWNVGLEGRWKAALIEPYIGDARRGQLHEFGIGLRYAPSWGRWNHSFSLRHAETPSFANKTFAYQRWMLDALSRRPDPWSKGSYGFMAAASQTRGSKTRELREVYQPLQTYIPGVTKGLNDLSFPLIAVTGGLFDFRYGDNAGD